MYAMYSQERSLRNLYSSSLDLMNTNTFFLLYRITRKFDSGPVTSATIGVSVETYDMHRQIDSTGVGRTPTEKDSHATNEVIHH